MSKNKPPPIIPAPQKSIEIMRKLPEDILTGVLGDFLSLKEKMAVAELCIKNPSNAFRERLIMMDKPKLLTAKLLAHVVHGEQNGADALLETYREFQHKSPLTSKEIQTVLLQRTGDITDYAGRTFKKITAYEYAFWAKDTYMCRMLEKHMDKDTKAYMLKRCETIEKDGLTYEQHGVTKNSTHFSFAPLLEAYNDYIQADHRWRRNIGPKDALIPTWLAIGLAQRDVPVHVINEYCRTDRSLHPVPEFNEPELPREITYRDLRGEDNDDFDNFEFLFPLNISQSSGLGVDFTLFRVSPDSTTAWGASSGLDEEYATFEAAAIRRLDEVRTAGIQQSLTFLRNLEEVEQTVRPGS